MDEMRTRVKGALRLVTGNAHLKSLDYAVRYARRGLTMLKEGATTAELYDQLLYVLGNLAYWRSDEATRVRRILKDAIDAWRPNDNIQSYL